MNMFIRALLFTLLLLVQNLITYAADHLPKVNANISEVSVSGLSSGGYMAVQFHIAHSQLVKGIGVFAGGPYYCAKGSFITAKERCMQPRLPLMLPNIKELIDFTNSLALKNKIDDVKNLHQARVFLFSGTKDSVVLPSVMQGLADFYKSYTVAENIIFKSDIDAGHAMITHDHGQACAATSTPFINNCGYDGAGITLKHIYGPLQQPTDNPLSGTMVAFDQREFLPTMTVDDASAVNHFSFAEIGYAYIPQSCHNQQCRVHVFFHGCKQNAETIQKEVIDHAGFNRWADVNNIIILYPQMTEIALNPLHPQRSNPMGCWDWWGYTGDDYYSRQAAQIITVKKMIERLCQKDS